MIENTLVKFAQSTFAKNFVNIDWVKSFPQSPDLNPIEWVWADWKRYVRKQLCSSEKKLVTAVIQFWGKVTHMYCSNFIDHLRKVNSFLKQFPKQFYKTYSNLR